VVPPTVEVTVTVQATLAVISTAKFGTVPGGGVTFSVKAASIRNVRNNNMAIRYILDNKVFVLCRRKNCTQGFFR
jgi:hypothetical protein